MNMEKLALFIDNTRKRLQKFIYQKFFSNFKSKKNVIDYFHKLYYDSKKQTRKNTFFLGTITFKCPLDLWIYQEILFDLKLDIIIECGTAAGGSALFLALICDSLNKGKIVTIDIEEKNNRPKHKRITYLSGSTTSKEIVEKVQSFIRSTDKIVVILDSDHHKDHVLRELEIYSKFVTKGSYIIVEDTNINGHPVRPKFGPGPMEAVEEFLKGNRDFVIDKSREKFFLTFNPNGYLKKIP